MPSNAGSATLSPVVVARHGVRGAMDSAGCPLSGKTPMPMPEFLKGELDGGRARHERLRLGRRKEWSPPRRIFPWSSRAVL